jgi:hypothetical protein
MRIDAKHTKFGNKGVLPDLLELFIIQFSHRQRFIFQAFGGGLRWNLQVSPGNWWILYLLLIYFWCL